MISLIAAAAENGVIGIRGQLPWHLPKDFAWFKQATTGKCIIMGRKTFESLDGKPLPKRLNIIISRTSRENTENVAWVSSLDEAVALAQKNAAQYGDEIMIIGGGEIYKETLSLANRIYLTEVQCAPNDGDAFFPEFDKSAWKKTVLQEHEAVENRPAFKIIQYDKI
jgi:dihydrofolate reductase